MSDHDSPRARAEAQERAARRDEPKLEYVAENLRSALQASHALYGRLLADDRASQASASRARASFHHQLLSYLALHDTLGLARDPELSSRLLTHSADEFAKWIDDIGRECAMANPAPL